MSDVRTRAGAVAVTAAALLALPVVAEGQVPVVGQIVSGGSGTVQSVTEQRPPSALLDAPAGQPPSAPAPPAPFTSRTAAVHPQPAPARSPAASSHGAGGPAGTSSPKSAGTRHVGASAASSSARKKAKTRAGASGEESAADARQEDGGSAGSSAADVTNVGGDSAARLPFTGFELLLAAMAGLAMFAGGALLRHGARHPRV
jgi:hypothetical protein